MPEQYQVRGDSAASISASIEAGVLNGDWVTGYNAGIGNGNQTSFTFQAPINVCGNAVAVLGFANGRC